MARLDQICILNMGQSPDSSSYNEIGEGVPFFQGNADFGKVHPKVRVWCSAPTKIAQSGDVLISVRAPIGALNIADRECCIGRGLAALTVNKAICVKEYLWYAIASKVDELNSKGTGSTFKAISKNVLAETDIPLPCLLEQLKIAERLAKVDELIDLRKEQLAKLDQLAKSRFIELFGDLKINSKLWCECKIDEACSMIVDCVNKTAPTVEEKTPYKMIRTTNVKRGRIDTENVRFVEKEIFDKWTRRAVPQMGDIILTREAPMGEVGMIATDESVFLGQRLVLYRVNPNRMNATYLMHLIMSDYFQEQVAYKGKGSTVKHLPVPDCTEFNVLIPNIELQEQFATFVEQIDKSKLTIQQSLEKLELLKKSLMQEYFG